MNPIRKNIVLALKRAFGRAITLDDINADRERVGEALLDTMPKEYSRVREQVIPKEAFPLWGYSPATRAYYDICAVETTTFRDGLLERKVTDEFRADGSVRKSTTVNYEPPGSWSSF